MNIMVAHPVDLMRTAIGALLDNAEFEVVGTCQSLTALRAAMQTQAPDVIILGEQLEPEGSIWDLIDQVQALSPARMVLLGSVADGYVIQTFFKREVAAYLYQYDALSSCLLDALLAVRGGREYLSPTATSEYLCAAQSPRPDYWTLDKVERKILRLLARGNRPKEIAAELQETARYVYYVVEQLRERFGAASTAELVLQALYLKLL